MTDDKDHKPTPLRKGAVFAPASKQGVSVAFGVDYLYGAFVIRYPDGTLERIRLNDE